MGIETGADSYTPRAVRRATSEVRAELAARGLEVGDAIMQLDAGMERLEPWGSHPEFLAQAPEAGAILYGALDELDYVNYIRLQRGSTPPKDVLEALEPWKPLLTTRAEITRNSTRMWWETAWPRDASALASAKIIGLHRASRGRFALDEHGAWKPGKNAAVVVGRASDSPVAYLCGLLNSELLDLWYALRGKTSRDIWRDYEPKRMNEMPYRRPEDDPRADEVADLVREIAANRRALLPHRAVVRDLGRIVKDPWKSGPVTLDHPALVSELEKRAMISVRLDPDLSIERKPAGRPRRDAPDVVVFRRGREETGRVTGSPERLDLLLEIVGTRQVDDLGSIVLPKDLAAFEQRVAERAATVSTLLLEGREKVEQVERLVCALYGLPDALTDAVVQHAVERAAR